MPNGKIAINLLPPEIKAAQIRRRQAKIAVIAGGLIVGVMICLFAVRLMKANNISKKISLAKIEFERYRPIAEKVNALEASRSQIQKRHDVIAQLLKGRLLYPVFFETFLAVKPNGVWLTNIETLPEGYGLKLSVSAQSSSSYAIADWINNLENSVNFHNVELGAISASGAGPGATLNFTIKCVYKEKI